MKNLILKSMIIIPAVLFIDILIMITIGCVSSLLGFTHDFYECTYCIIGKFVFFTSLAGLVIIFALNILSNNKTEFN